MSMRSGNERRFVENAHPIIITPAHTMKGISANRRSQAGCIIRQHYHMQPALQAIIACDGQPFRALAASSSAAIFAAAAVSVMSTGPPLAPVSSVVVRSP